MVALGEGIVLRGFAELFGHFEVLWPQEWLGKILVGAFRTQA